MSRNEHPKCDMEIGVLKGKLEGQQRMIDEHQARMDNIDKMLAYDSKDLKSTERLITDRIAQLEKKQFAIYAIAGFVGTVAAIIVKLL